jgi:hypothetical protein
MQPYRVGNDEAGLRDFAREFRTRFKRAHVRKGASILEIGSFVGDSTRILIDEISPARVVCVDPWNQQMPGYHVADGNVFAAFQKNVQPIAQQRRCDVIVVPKTSSDFFAGVSDRKDSFDLVYIDAIHTYEAVMSDIQGSLPLLRDAGTLAGHDYSPKHHLGVVEAVNHMHGSFNGRFYKLEVFADTTWALIPKGSG